MAVLGRPLPRFFLWATLLVGVAVATAAAGLSWWLIAVVELAAWAIVSLVERTLWQWSLAPLPEVRAPVAGPVVAEPAAPAATAEPRVRLQPRSVAPANNHWDIWSLEKLAREHPEAEELEFLVLSLRDFADADGRLPSDFDSLVRESFGELLTK